jgi:hypothetical protein
MLRRILLILYLFIVGITIAPRASAALHGSWHARMHNDHSLQLSLSYQRNSESNNEWGHTVELTDFTGLTDAQIHSSGNTPVKFTLTRGAGTITLDGIFGDGDGGGRFTFTPNAKYADELHSLGVASSDLDEEQLFSLAILDVSTQFIRDMQALGYRGPLEDFKRFRIHGASPQFVRDMQALGYRDLSAEDLIRFRIHGVSPEYVRDMNVLGYKPSAEDLVRFRIHGVNPELVKTLNGLGYRDVSAEDLVRFRIHGVSPEFLRDIKDLGYTPNAEDLVRMRIHGVSPEFIRSLKEAGYNGIPVEKLIEMRIHGIDAKYLKAMSK